MSYLPPIPPVVPPNAELGAEWIKRYMADQSQFRDVLRKWIVSANACCDSNTAAISALDVRVTVLEDVVSGGIWDLGSVSDAVDDGIFDFGSV